MVLVFVGCGGDINIIEGSIDNSVINNYGDLGIDGGIGGGIDGGIDDMLLGEISSFLSFEVFVVLG